MARVASLHIYPVKSCHAIDVDTTLVTATGPEWDRRWMIIRPPDRFVTQRDIPALATIGVGVGNGVLRLWAEGRGSVEVEADHDGERSDVRIWNDRCRAIDAGDEAAAWLTSTIGEPLRLVRIDPAVARLADPQWAGEAPHPVTFTDAYPILMISKESLAELNRRLPAPVPMTRFRPNVVIEGVDAHAEDAMTQFRIGRSIVLRGVKHCTRCPVTTTDQQTGALDPRQQPLRALHTYRHDYALKGVTFGQNCVVEAGIGARISVGDSVAIE